ncbi:hypothetical protein TRIUR3_24860 [Triticum urartu]|uniref:Uncharacterized protein n=1 Tax=Triticum urartu TaxID=4572 RepID=M7Z8J9_TRIUA|nr:hypothetical protein TRIUR3_24860 [Triticum urartu]
MAATGGHGCFGNGGQGKRVESARRSPWSSVACSGRLEADQSDGNDGEVVTATAEKTRDGELDDGLGDSSMEGLYTNLGSLSMMCE